jgi:hypothetical protein
LSSLKGFFFGFLNRFSLIAGVFTARDAIKVIVLLLSSRKEITALAALGLSHCAHVLRAGLRLALPLDFAS